MRKRSSNAVPPTPKRLSPGERRRLRKHWTTKRWTKPLSPKQKRALEDFKRARRVVAGHHKKTYDSVLMKTAVDRKGNVKLLVDNRGRLEQDQISRSLIDNLEQATLRAIRAGLMNHPVVYPAYTALLRGPGKWEALRTAKRFRAEKGVRSPIRINEEVRKTIVKLAEEKRTWKEVQEELGYSRSAFHRLRKRCAIPSLSEIRKARKRRLRQSK